MRRMQVTGVYKYVCSMFVWIVMEVKQFMCMHENTAKTETRRRGHLVHTTGRMRGEHPLIGYLFDPFVRSDWCTESICVCTAVGGNNKHFHDRKNERRQKMAEVTEG